ncbi:MAG: hypothetical protein JXJ30_03935, partial [Halothiobacillaceae bacterium]|nr:hypothetical protein [Halothiobacillaceae bacterium]
YSTLASDGLPLFRGKMGNYKGNKAIRVDEAVPDRLERAAHPNEILRAQIPGAKQSGENDDG